MIADDEIAAVAIRYLAGMQEEFRVLRGLLAVSQQQREAAQPDSVLGLASLVEQRQGAEEALHLLERTLRPMRTDIAAQEGELERRGLHAAVREVHATARALVNDILDADRTTLAALTMARGTRGHLLEQLDAGEATLAAYRRVITPGLARAELIDRRG